MNNISSNILEAMKLLAEAETKKLQFDTTIEAIIYNNSNASVGEYKIKYQNAIFDAYTDNTSVIYKIDEVVFVLVPQGNLNNKKLITGRKTTNSNEYIEVVDPLQQVDLVGIPFDRIYGYAIGEYQIPGYHDSNSIVIFQNSGDANADQLFQQYSKNQKILVIKTDFKTSFNASQKIDFGNYGILVVLKAKIGDAITTVPYVLDRNNMIGNPFTNINYISQALILDIKDIEVLGVESIELFSQNFNHYKPYPDDNQTIPDAELTIPEISTTNLTLQFARTISGEDGFSANILTPDGFILNETLENVLRLKAQFKYNGVVTAPAPPRKESNYQIYWFQRDNRVQPGNDNYSQYGGKGWALIGDNVDNISIVSSMLSNIMYVKLVIVYQKAIIRIDEIQLLRSQLSLTDFYIEGSKDSNNIITLEVKARDGLNLDGITNYKWAYETSNGMEYERVENSKQISFDGNLIENSVLYTCCLYENTLLIDTLTYTLSRFIDDGSVEVGVDFSTDQLGFFNYDINGYVAVKEFLISKQLSFTPYWKDEPKGYQYMWILPGDGYEVTAGGLLKEDYAPSNSMLRFPKNTRITGDSSIANQFLDYLIRSNFNRNANNNTVKLQLTVDGQVFLFSFNFVFLKQGDIGTNGTDYQLYYRIRSNNHSFYLDSSNNWINTSIVYELYVYHNGILDDISNYTITCKKPEVIPAANSIITTWSLSGNLLTINCSSLKGASLSATITMLQQMYGSVLEVRAVPKTTIDTNKYNIYSFISTDISIGSKCSIEEPLIIQYNAAGYNPSFSYQPLRIYNPDDLNDSTVWSFSRIGVSDSLIVSIDNITGVPRVKSMYEAKLGIAAVLATYNASYIISSIVFISNAYELHHINDWDGVSVTVDNSGGYILAPQVGAGAKDAFNRFSGVILGQYNPNSGSPETGLWGFYQGQQSFGFKEDGTAFIGTPSGGRIEIDGNTGFIKSANYVSGTSGMKIDLSSGLIDAYNFKLTSANITFDSDNKLIRVRNNAGGIVFEANGNSTTGTGILAGWNFVGGSNARLYAGSTSLYATGRIVTASLEASSGNIGPWYINSEGIYIPAQQGGSGGSSYIYSDGRIKIVDNDGWGLTLSSTSISLYAVGYNGFEFRDGVFRLNARGSGWASTFIIDNSGLRIEDNYYSVTRVYLGYSGLWWTVSDVDRFKIGFAQLGGPNAIAPYLRMGAGGYSASDTFSIAKNLSYLWLGNGFSGPNNPFSSNTSGIRIYSNYVEIIGELRVNGTTVNVP